LALQSEQFHEQQHKQLLVCSKWNLLVPNIKDLFHENLLNPNVPLNLKKKLNQKTKTFFYPFYFTIAPDGKSGKPIKS
jgi:hypothetical protein